MIELMEEASQLEVKVNHVPMAPFRGEVAGGGSLGRYVHVIVDDQGGVYYRHIN